MSQTNQDRAGGSERDRTDAKDRPGTTGYQPEFLDSAEFAEMTFRHNWLVDSVLMAKQPAVIGGPVKSLKTSVGIDLAVSLATGTPFLDTFKVPRRRRVAVVSGESGVATIQETAVRVCKSKGLRLKDCDASWSFDLPRLDRADDRATLRRFVRANRVQVVILDPLYLLLGCRGASASDLYQIGPLLHRAGKACLDAGATPVIVHHCVKGTARKGEPLGLDDLAFAGIGEYVRQWMLLGRRIPYVPGTGAHELSLVVGGSAGHSGRWDVTINEGVLSTTSRRRVWHVEVREPSGEGPELGWN